MYRFFERPLKSVRCGSGASSVDAGVLFLPGSPQVTGGVDGVSSVVTARSSVAECDTAQDVARRLRVHLAIAESYVR